MFIASFCCAIDCDCSHKTEHVHCSKIRNTSIIPNNGTPPCSQTTELWGGKFCPPAGKPWEKCSTSTSAGRSGYCLESGPPSGLQSRLRKTSRGKRREHSCVLRIVPSLCNKVRGHVMACRYERACWKVSYRYENVVVCTVWYGRYYTCTKNNVSCGFCDV